MLTVRDAMTPHVITVRPETPLKEVAQVLIDANVSGLPVVDDAGKVLGVVSEADFLIKGQGALAIRHRRLARLLGESGSSRQQLHKLAARTAAEAMTTPPVTIAPSESLAEAAARMVQRRVNRLPVVEKGWLVGRGARRDDPGRRPPPLDVARPGGVRGPGSERRGTDPRARGSPVDGRDHRGDGCEDPGHRVRQH